MPFISYSVMTFILIIISIVYQRIYFIHNLILWPALPYCTVIRNIALMFCTFLNVLWLFVIPNNIQIEMLKYCKETSYFKHGYLMED